MSGRREKVSVAVQREVAKVVLREMRDPRLKLVTITSCEVSRDFSVARVHVSAMGDEQALGAAVEALQDASGFVRTKIAPHLSLRHMPELIFVADDTAAKAQRLELLFREQRDEFGEAPAVLEPVEPDPEDLDDDEDWDDEDDEDDEEEEDDDEEED